jgi:prepilin-type N-terminal cleavage/methylation domain-containing protein
MPGLLLARNAAPRRQAGFTLVEVLIVMGLMAVLITMTTISLIRPQTSASIASTVSQLVNDLKAQQLRSMSGNSGSATSAQANGVYVQSGTYTLFKGSTYSAGDADNFAVSVTNGVTLSTTFASTQVVFTKGTGEVTGFSAGANTITVTNATSGQTKTITLNRYGVITVN